MLGQAHLVNVPPNKVATKTAFTLQHLWRQASWASAAAAALLVAILAGLSDVGAQRAGTLISSLNPASSSPQHVAQTGRQPLDPEAAARQLAQTVRGLAEDRDRMMTRLAAVERNMDDVTGSITRQIEEVKATTTQGSPPPWPEVATPAGTPSASGESIAEPVVPPVADLAPPLTSTPAAPVVAATPATPSLLDNAATSPAEAASAAPPAYGADIGSASSIKALQAHWAAIHAAHASMFEGLHPVVTLRDRLRSNHIELRLVVGPLPNAERAAKLCASLAAFHLPCQPTMFDGRQLALQ